MIRAHFGLERDPFSRDRLTLLPHQKDVLDTLRVHCHQGGFCVVIGEPGTGKSVLKDALVRLDKKRLHVPVVGRTLHTYHSTLRILFEAFNLETKGRTTVCERGLIDEAHAIHQRGHMLAPLIDDGTCSTSIRCAVCVCSSTTSPSVTTSSSSHNQGSSRRLR